MSPISIEKNKQLFKISLMPGRIIRKVIKITGKFLCRYRNNLITKSMVQCLEVFRNSIENVNFNSKTNGEEQLLKKISGLNIDIIFDAGANTGEWAKTAKKYFPDSKLHSFEILPVHWNEFKRNTTNIKNIFLKEFGLSDSDNVLEIYYNSREKSDSMASAYPQFLMKSERNYYNSKTTCVVKKGETYLLENKIEKIDILKIDVEGHELKVIKGFGNFIQNIRLIQFEYGVYNITSKDLLCDFFSYLESYNFMIGRLYPSCVDFFDYEYTKENFLGGNFIAINNGDEELKALLTRF